MTNSPDSECTFPNAGVYMREHAEIRARELLHLSNLAKAAGLLCDADQYARKAENWMRPWIK